MIGLLFYAVIALFLAGTVISLPGTARDTRIIRILSLACTAGASLVLAVLSLIILVTGVPFTPAAWQLFPGFSVDFFIDRLAAFFLFLIGSVSSCVAVYTMGYVEHMEGGNRRNLLCGCISLFVLAMALIVASENTLSFLIFWELMAAVSFFLVMYEYTQGETRKAGIFYFVMTHLSTLFVMLGIIAFYYASGSFAIAPLYATPASLPLVTAAFLSLFVGFSIKAGIIPFHKWLPYAHPASPSPVSALMSGVMLKVAVYGLLRFIITVFSPELWWGVLILALGIASAVLGVIYALKEHDIKGMLAYSSIENIGIIFVGIGLFVIFSCSGLALLATISLLAALFHSLNHALFKSLLFLTAGSVVHATHTRDIEKMGGLSGKMPYTSVLFFTGAIAIAALPPLNGFASELLMYIAFFHSVTVVDPLLKVLLFICLALFALTSALSAACFVKAFGSVFLAQPRSPESEGAHEVNFPMLAGPAILAAACVILGVFAYQILAAFGYVLPIPDLFLVSVLLLIMAALTYVVLYFTASRDVRISETWGCGAKSQPSSTEYTGHGFSEPIVTIFSSIYRTKKSGTKTYYDQHDCIFAEGTAEIRLLKFFEKYLYLPIARGASRASARIARIQNGCLDTYLLYVFIAVVAVILFLGWSA
ncbi:MAG: proton-conducting transporter membrane subunit [Methanoregula sp.]|uniref:proton-conducting transporter transmembrane domain-containing protein n=1 Tax=Methanoregula sp. TaxID=2052170 RepID=UPI003C78C745